MAQRGRIESLEGELDEAKAALEEAQATIERLRAPPPTDFAEGDAVWVRWCGTWYRARVLDVPAEDAFHVTYEGYPSRWDETVGLDRIARRPPAASAGSGRGRWLLIAIVITLAALAGWMLLPDEPGDPVHDVSQLEVGQSVSVLWNGRWFDAEVIAPGRDGRVRVRYDGYATEWDESVTADRVRR